MILPVIGIPAMHGIPANQFARNIAPVQALSILKLVRMLGLHETRLIPLLLLHQLLLHQLLLHQLLVPAHEGTHGGAFATSLERDAAHGIAEFAGLN